MGSWAERTGAEGSGREMPEQDLSLDWMLKKSRHHIAPKHGQDRTFRCPEATCPRKGKVWARLDNFRQHLKRMHQLEPTDEVIAKAEQGVHDREELPQQDSSLDWMLDSSHVNVGLWNHFDGHRFVTEEQGVHDREELPQQGSSLDRSLPPSHVNVDLLSRLDRRAFRAEEQGLGDPGAGVRGYLPPLITMSSSSNDTTGGVSGLTGSGRDLGGVAHYQNTSAGPPEDNLLSSASGSTALSISEHHGRPAELLLSTTDDFKDSHHYRRRAARDRYEYDLIPFQDAIYEYRALDDALDDGSDDDLVVTHHNVVARPESLSVLGSESTPRHGNSSQQSHVLNEFPTTKDQLHLPAKFPPDAPLTYHSTRSPEGPLICQRCNYPQRFDCEADLQRHMAASHPTRKVWITVDISSDKKVLANCKACRTGKRYGAYINAAAHLRQVHLNTRVTRRGHKYGVPSNPPILKEWIQEVDEKIDTEHQVSQLALPEIRVLDASQGTTDSHSSKDDLGPPRHGQRTALPLNGPSLSTNSELKKQCTHQEAGRLTTHNQCPTPLDDQLLNPYPKRQKSTSSHRSADSGYISDGMMQYNQLKGEKSSCWSKSEDDGNLLIKSEPTDLDVDVIALIPKDESHHHAEKQAKEEPSETLKVDTKPSRESGCKGEHESEYFYMKNEPEVVRRESETPSLAKKYPGQSQHSSEPYNFKRKRKVHTAPTFAVSSGDSKSDSIVDMDIEKELANPKYHKADYTKDDVCTMEAEPNHVEAPSVTAGLQQPVVSFNKEPSQPRHRHTVPLPFGHPKSRQWTEMLPSIKACTREIMGKGNRGALELFMVNEEPTICITCWDPSKLNLALVESCMEPLGLHINVTQGKIEKSASDEHDGPSGAAVPDEDQCRWPSIHGHYMQRPTCGASLGTADGPLKSGKVSLGGYLKIKHLYQSHWSYYAMTVHHILVSGDEKDHCLSIRGDDEDEEMAEPGYDYSPRVCNGVYELEDGAGVRVTLSCPAVPDVRSLVARLEGRRIKRCANKSYAAIDNLDNLDDLLYKLCTRECTDFGNAAWSSGLCLDQNVEMDWLLIGDLPLGRIGCNKPGDVTAYMEGNHQDSIYQGCWTPSAFVEESDFSTLMNFSALGWGKPGSEGGGYLSRVFGRGSETGLADGFLSPHPSVFLDETNKPYDAWAFAPRYPGGLGTSGDSGTWIFTSEGMLLGQIISYNRAHHITYFTPMCKIFNHIKRITGATDVELLTPEDITENPRITPRSASGLLSPEEEIFKLNNRSSSTTTNSRSSADSSAAQERFIPPPRTPASSSEPLPFPFNHVSFPTAGLPTPGSTQAGDSSD